MLLSPKSGCKGTSFCAHSQIKRTKTAKNCTFLPLLCTFCGKKKKEAQNLGVLNFF